MKEETRIDRSCFIRRICAAGLLGTAAAPILAGPDSGHGKKFRLLDHPRHRRDWSDSRSRRVIFLAHCIPNMNARMHGTCRVFASSAEPLIRFCLDRKLGMAVMPCPELLVTGLGRDRDEPEKDYLRQALEEPVSRQRIRELARQVVFQMTEYRFQGFDMVAVLGNDGSPSCGVNRTAFPDPDNRFGPGQGVFFQELRKLMAAEDIDLPMKGIEDDRIEETVAWLERIVVN